MSSPLLELSSVTLVRDDQVLIAGASLAVHAERVGFRGKASRLLELFRGELEVRSGQIRIAGTVFEQLPKGFIGTAFPLPGSSPLSIREMLALHLMLGGEPRHVAHRRVDEHLEGLGLAAWGQKRLGRGCGVDHHLAGLLRAALDGPEVVVVKWPIGRLGPEAWVRYGGVLAQLLEGRRWLVGLENDGWLPIERAWQDRLEELVDETRLGFVTRPRFLGDRTSLLVTVYATEDASAAFVANLTAHGCSVVQVSQKLVLESTFLVTMPDGVPNGAPTRPLLALALESAVRVVRLETLDDGAREGMLAGSAAAPEPSA